MANTYPKYKVFSLVTYAEAEQIDEILNQKFEEGIIDAFAYVLHNKDTTDDGSRKEPHFHVVLQSTAWRTAISVKNWFSATRDFKGELANTFVECTHKRIEKGQEIIEKVDRHGATCYLAHEDKDGKPLANKHHYGWDDVVAKNIDILKTPVQSGRKPKEDCTFKILEKVMNGINFFDLAKEYGRDFILNWTKYRDLASHVYGRALEEEEKRRERERIDFELEALAKSCERRDEKERLEYENALLKAKLVSAGIIFEKD